jgi:UDP-N-acetylglucosamine 2-epimerase (hydrolysing)
MRKILLFVTGTRADFGKLKPLLRAVQNHPDFDYRIFGTGMHMLKKYGNTLLEIKKEGFDNLFPCFNQMEGDSMEIILANTITALARYLDENHIDMIVTHGDRIEALATAITGSLRNILVAHVEGGEISGTIDDLMRHATSKLSHIHFVASLTAKNRLVQLGEDEKSIFQIGSPDVDIMLSDSLPVIEEVRKHYEIEFGEYAIAMLHPVTTETEYQYQNAKVFVEALIASGKNYVIIYPNNDLGSEDIFRVYKEKIVAAKHKTIKMFPSLRFEYFLTLLKNAQFIIGNSSTGIHEAPVYGVPTINIGSRQDNRFEYQSILNTPFDKEKILEAIDYGLKKKRFPRTDHYGKGDSAEKFIKVISSPKLWNISKQKKFKDLGTISGK